MKNPLLYRLVRPESSREASERFLMETLGKNYRPIRQHSGSSRRALQTGRGASTDTHSDSRCFAAESHCGRRRTTAKGVWVKSHPSLRQFDCHHRKPGRLGILAINSSDSVI